MMEMYADSVEMRASYLLAIFRRLGLDVKISDFDHRLKLQKIVYLLQLHPEFSRYLNYPFSMFIYGPYSPELARVYYNISDATVKPVEVSLSEEALDYGRRISSHEAVMLETMATIIEARKVNRNKPLKEILEHVEAIKPYSRRCLEKALAEIKDIENTYRLNLLG